MNYFNFMAQLLILQLLYKFWLRFIGEAEGIGGGQWVQLAPHNCGAVRSVAPQAPFIGLGTVGQLSSPNWRLWVTKKN